MLTDLTYVIGASMALFLVGANAAFVINLGRELAMWFTFKILAVDLVFIYMALSLFLGEPGWRAYLGVIALLIDIIALIAMWISIERLRNEGIIGLLPISRSR